MWSVTAIVNGFPLYREAVKKEKDAKKKAKKWLDKGFDFAVKLGGTRFVPPLAIDSVIIREIL